MCCFPELFETQASLSPEKVAVVDLDHKAQLSYAELEERSRQLAQRLLHLGAGPESRIGVLLGRSPDMVVAVVAVLRAGAAYVPLDKDQPPRRLRQLADDARLHAVLVQGPDAPLPCPVIRLDEACEETGEALPQPLPAAAAYVLYTSGSTGRPKGVTVTHASLGAFLDTAASSYGFTAEDRVLQFSPLTFDLSVLEIFPVLARGATVVLSADGMSASVHEYLQRCEAAAVSAVFPPTSFWHELAAALAAGSRLPSFLRLVCFGTEAVSPARVTDWIQAVGESGPRLINGYGATETTVDVSSYDVGPADAGRAFLPVGRPIRGADVRVLDARLRELPDGDVGQLAVSGPGLARGYLGMSARTAQVFVPHPSSDSPGQRLYLTGDRGRRRGDGNLEVLGRIDHQLKVRGFRLEPGEIESVLGRHPSIREVAVVAWQAQGGPRLVAWVATHLPAPSAAELRTFLDARLPSFMVPSLFAFVDALPRRSGKVDRRRLARRRPPGLARKQDGGYANPTEETLARVWAKVLGVNAVAPRDNFFDLGGDSILNLRIAARAREAGLLVHPRDVFKHPSVAELVASGAVGQSRPAPATPLEPTAELRLTPIQHWFFELDVAEPWHFNQAQLLTLSRCVPPDVLRRAVGILIKHHGALRLRFERRPELRQRCAPFDGEVPFTWAELQDTGTEELRCQAERVQASLDLGDGPLRRAGLFTCPGRPGAVRPGAGPRVLALHHPAGG